MAERPDAYFRKNPGDVIQSNEWNELQIKAREEIRAHRHTGNEDGNLIPRSGIEAGAIDGKLIDPAAEVSIRTLTTSGNLTVKGDLTVNGKALLGDIADLLATIKGLQDDKLNRRGDTVSGTLRVEKNLLVDGRVGVGTSDACTKLEVIGGALISNGSGFAVQANHMASGSLTIGGTSTGYGGGRGWGSSTAGLLLEAKGTTEIAVHDAGTRLASLLYYNDNSITIGRDMGWGPTPLMIGNSDLYFTNIDHTHSAYGNETGYAAIENAANYGALMILGRNIGTRSACNRIVKLWDYLEVNGKLAVNGDVGIGTTAPSHRFHVVALDAVGLFESSGETACLRLSTKEGLDNRVEIANRPGGRLSLWNNGKDVFNITRNGNVGIGTTTPAQKLIVEGGHNSGRDPDSGLLYGGQLAIKGNAPQIDFIDTDHDDWAIMVNGSKMHFIKEPWTYTNLVLAANGNVGIGTDNPVQQLTITGGLGFANQGAVDKKLYSPKDGLLEWMTHDAAGEHGFAVSHQGQVRVCLSTNGNSYLNGGNVGIGTTAPSHRFHVVAENAVGLFESSGEMAFLRLSTKEGLGNRVEIANRPGGRLSLWNNGQDVLNINRDGNVGIGTTTPNQKLEVVGNLNVTGRINGKLEYLVSDDGRWRLIMQGDRNLVVYGPSNEVVWHINKALSDLELKKELIPIKNATASLMSLRGVSFAWKDEEMGTGREFGIIAQEVEAVFPELVSAITGRKFVSYQGLIPVLIEAIKEQQAQIAELRNSGRIQ